MINPKSELAQRFWEAGEGLPDCPIYDFHGHMHEMAGGWLPASDPEKMLVTMRRANIESFIFCSHLALYCAEVGESSNYTEVEKYGTPLHAYMAVKSFDPDFERDLKIYKEHPQVYKGFKFLADYYGVPLNADCHTPYWNYANENGLLCLCHTWGGSPCDGAGNVRAIAERWPNVKLIVAHSIHGDWNSAIQLAKDFPNLYLELTALMDDDRGVLERFVNEVGSERMLFGTDLPWFSTFQAIGCILDAEMTDDDRRNIFYRNGMKLLGIPEK